MEMDADVNAAINIKKKAELPPAPRRAGVPDVNDARSELSPVSSRLTQHDAA
jgi:transposase